MPAGRPSTYTTETATQAAKLCELGATDAEIADFFDVDVRTIHRWKLKHDEFCHALKAGKSFSDDRTERSLYHKANGYDYVEEQAIKIKVDQYKETVEVVEVTRHQPADTTAAIFWLKNRRPDRWRDKRDIDVTRNIRDMSQEEIQSELKAIDEELALMATDDDGAATA